MNTQQFHPEQIELLQAVFDMRQKQIEYFKQRTENRLKAAKVAERKLDNLLLPYIKAGAIKVPFKPTQSTLL